jgi:hypothetical protein
MRRVTRLATFWLHRLDTHRDEVALARIEEIEAWRQPRKGRDLMNLGKLADEAKKLIDKRGGMKSVKEDARELKDIAGEKGSMADKAKDAAEALKDPGAPGDPAGTPRQSSPTPPEASP